MKKFILASAFALMATPALFAQSSNTYSMQIELKDGTKITLGPNDLKNITFVDGVIKIEGNTIEELRSSIEKCEAQTLNVMEKQQDNYYVHEKMMAELQADQAASNAKIAKVQDMVATIEVAIMDLQKAVKELQSSGDGSVGNEERIKLLEEAVDKLKADMKNLSNIEQVKQLQDQIYALQAMVNVVATNSTGNQALADELKVKMTAVEAALANLKNSSMNSQVQIDKLTVESNNVQDDLNATKEEFRANIQTLAAAIAKTNNFAENEVANIRRNLDDMIEKVASINTAVDDAEKDRAAIYAAIDAVNKDRQAQAAKIETLDGYTKSMRTTLEGLIDNETNARMTSINELNKTILDKYNELRGDLDWIIRFLNSNVLSDYNTFDNWLKEIQQR